MKAASEAILTDLIRKTEKIQGQDITCVLNYRLNFDGEKACGSVAVYSGPLQEDNENYEAYLELLECGLKEEEVEKRFQNVIRETREGKIDVRL